MNDNEQFANRIANLRKERLMSQKEFGELLGVSNKAVSKWENGDSFPQMKTIIKMAEIFEISPSELMTGAKIDSDNETLKEEQVSESQNAKLLEAENKKLLSQLNKAKKNKRDAIIFCAMVLAAFVIIAVLVVLSTPQDKSKLNATVSNIGSQNSYIEYCDKRFYPVSDAEKYLYNCYYDYQETMKYAQLLYDNKTQDRVLIYCNRFSDYVVVPYKDKSFIYVTEDARRELSADFVYDIYICSSKVMSIAEKAVRSGDIIDVLDYDYFYENGEELIKKDIYFEEDINLFFECLKNKSLPDNAKDITKKYLTDDNSYTVIISLQGGDLRLGNLFTDDKGNYYIYLFDEAQTYLLGKEMKDIVK